MRNGRGILYVSGLFGQRGFDVGQHLFAQQHERLLGASGRRAGAAHVLAGEEALGHGAGRGIGIAEEMRVGQVQPILQRLAVKAGADGGVEERLARAELLKLMRAEQQTVLFRQVKTTSLSERSWSSGL